MLIASIYFTVDPTWPWDTPIIGLPLLALVAAVLVGLTIWTYIGVGQITLRRLLIILLLRLAALAVACLLVLRPALARQDDETIMPTKLIFLVDSSESMNITDEAKSLSRWEYACEILSSPVVVDALKHLARDNKVEVVYYQGAEGVRQFEPHGGANGKRTDFGTWLHDLEKMHGNDGNLRGLLIFSDGADNGTRYELFPLLNRWAAICPINTFALGQPNTSLKRRDIALADITPPSEPVPVKTQFTVSGRIDAWGYKDAPVDVSLWIEERPGGDMKMLGRKERVVLKKLELNDVTLTRDAPENAGEYKITLKVDPLPGEVTELNNEISSFITVTKEGISILWVEGRKRLESTFILRHALAKEKRFRLYPAERLGNAGPAQADWFNFDKQHYDVIVIGDISAHRFSSGQPDVFRQIDRLALRVIDRVAAAPEGALHPLSKIPDVNASHVRQITHRARDGPRDAKVDDQNVVPEINEVVS